ncbi:fungal-specific transcription factor domain-containing protein [Hypoxylon sp. FL1284]|nr:fungal-specific transcription factor domain-containing protein [Hypoxylon sp. FL1284]
MQRSKRRVRDGDGTRRLFTCTHDDCGKSFSRSEHLHRHQKNHTDGNATCPRCRAHFKRQDLLERHMSRHKQKDEEAGGEGSGTLNTRKRMWKDHDGRIVQKKPVEHQTLDNNNAGAPFAPSTEAPISPPVSSQNSEIPSDGDPTQASFVNEHSILENYTLSSGQYNSQGPTGYWIPPEAPNPRTIESPYFDINYDEVFQPDTASSFNMPYTTQVNYDWLFSFNTNFSGSAAPQDPYVPATSLASYSCDMQQQPPPMALGRTELSPGHGHYDSSTTESPLTSMVSLDYSRSRASTQNTTSPSISDGVTPSLPPVAKQTSPEGSEGMQEVEFERPLATLRSNNHLPSIDEFTYTRILDTVKSARPLVPNGSFLDINHPLLSRLSLQSYCDLYFTKFNTAYPLIHQATFEPSQKEILLLLSIILLGATYAEKDAHQLAVCMHDVIRPAIFSHASFNAKPDLWMLQTILLVECFGKSRAGQKQHDMSHLFHGMLINLIRRSDCQSVRPSRPGPGDGSVGDGVGAELEHGWRRWVEAEEKKRLALLCFMWDTQHAVLFCQSLCMSAFELRLPLPCSQALWEASAAPEWARLSAAAPPEPMYLLALKAYIAASDHNHNHNNADEDENARHRRAVPVPPRLNGLSRVLVLHGLMSVFWDMRRRDQTSLGVVAAPDGGGARWQTRIGDAYAAWKADFDDFCERQTRLLMARGSTTTTTKHAAAAAPELEAWRAAYVAVYHAAHVLLHSEFLDIQIFAGAHHILGRSVQRSDFMRSEKVVKRWAATSGRGRRRQAEVATAATEAPNNNSEYADDDASTAAWHASLLLQTSLSSSSSATLIDVDSAGLFHVPWCVYLATLTIWAYHHTASPAAAAASHDDDSELVWDPRASMRSVVESMARAGAGGLPALRGLARAGGLVWVVAEALGRVRWGIVREGVEVLKGLVPRRVIGQFEDVAT